MSGDNGARPVDGVAVDGMGPVSAELDGAAPHPPGFAAEPDGVGPDHDGLEPELVDPGSVGAPPEAAGPALTEAPVTGPDAPAAVSEVRPAGKPARTLTRRPRRRPLPAALLAESLLPVFDEPMKVMIFGLRRTRGACTEEVVALVHETPDCEDEVPLVRVHSACLTGDVFGSQKCDCGAQLHAALRDIRRSRRGALLYMLTHEGRGIGLASKIRAYHLQDEGLDTIAANVALGLPVDARDYAPAAAVLIRLGITEIDLLTNNPDKIESLLDFGLTVRNRVPISGYVTPQNADYLEVKDSRMGHLGAAEAVDESQVSPVVPVDGDA